MLKHRATNRLKLALADSTSRSYDSKFRIFLSFCSFAAIDINHISPLQILTFLEFLTFNNVNFSGLANHLSAVKTSLSLHGLDVSSFMDPRIKLYNKAIMRHTPFNPSIKPIIDIDTLQAIALQCDRMHMGHICKTAILLAFLASCTYPTWSPTPLPDITISNTYLEQTSWYAHYSKVVENPPEQRQG